MPLNRLDEIQATQREPELEKKFHNLLSLKNQNNEDKNENKTEQREQTITNVREAVNTQLRNQNHLWNIENHEAK